MKALPMPVAVSVGLFFDQLSSYLNEHFAVFWPARVKDTKNRFSAKHYEQYGWINFLKAIAKTKVFDIPNSGLNSIQCARMAPLFDVLVYASEEKLLNEAQYLDYEANKPK
jgi:hypothetical protein